MLEGIIQPHHRVLFKQRAQQPFHYNAENLRFLDVLLPEIDKQGDISNMRGFFLLLQLFQQFSYKT